MTRSPLALALLALAVAGCDSGDSFGPPAQAVITRVSVSAAPFFDENGDGWDGGDGLGNGPELYFRLFDASVDYQTRPGDDRLNPRDDDNVFATESPQPWYEDAGIGDLPMVWGIDPGYVVRDLSDPLYVALFDYDSNDDDPMAASEEFVLGDIAPPLTTGREQVLTLSRGFDRNGDLTEFTVRLTVLFED